MPRANAEKFASNIPPIKQLREKLDYGDPTLLRCKTFYDDLRIFCKRFKTSKGVEGLSLYDWRSPEHQEGLSEMAHEYLERAGNGMHFWPDNETSANYNTLKYSEDKILSVLDFV
jgi:hypothetical protein